MDHELQRCNDNGEQRRLLSARLRHHNFFLDYLLTMLIRSNLDRHSRRSSFPLQLFNGEVSGDQRYSSQAQWSTLQPQLAHPQPPSFQQSSKTSQQRPVHVQAQLPLFRALVACHLPQPPATPRCQLQPRLAQPVRGEAVPQTLVLPVREPRVMHQLLRIQASTFFIVLQLIDGFYTELFVRLCRQPKLLCGVKVRPHLNALDQIRALKESPARYGTGHGQCTSVSLQSMAL